MSTTELLGEDRGGGMPAEKAEWKRDPELIRREMQRIDEQNEGWPTCRLCGQRVNRLDEYGLCSKTSDIHQAKRGLPSRKRK